MSEFWKRKMRTYFTMFDVDKDGVISRDDWLWMAIPRVENAKKEFADHLTTQAVNVWEQIMKHNETGDKTKMNAELFTKAMEKLRYDPDLTKPFSELVKYLFYMTDTDGDGYLQDEEYERMLVQSGVKDTSFVKEAFKSIDTNGDGKLSIEEFVHAFFEFMSSDDEKNPNTHYFGPLVD